jgi:hypothetical protein
MLSTFPGLQAVHVLAEERILVIAVEQNQHLL